MYVSCDIAIITSAIMFLQCIAFPAQHVSHEGPVAVRTGGLMLVKPRRVRRRAANQVLLVGELRPIFVVFFLFKVPLPVAIHPLPVPGQRPRFLLTRVLVRRVGFIFRLFAAAALRASIVHVLVVVGLSLFIVFGRMKILPFPTSLILLLVRNDVQVIERPIASISCCVLLHRAPPFCERSSCTCSSGCSCPIVRTTIVPGRGRSCRRRSCGCGIFTISSRERGFKRPPAPRCSSVGRVQVVLYQEQKSPLPISKQKSVMQICGHKSGL